jgi:hypothetical protein
MAYQLLGSGSARGEDGPALHINMWILVGIWGTLEYIERRRFLDRAVLNSILENRPQLVLKILACHLVYACHFDI